MGTAHVAQLEEVLVGHCSSQFLPEFYVRDARYVRIRARPFGAGFAWQTEAHDSFAERLALRKGSPARDATVCLFLGTAGASEFRHLSSLSTLRAHDLLLIDSDAGFSIIASPNDTHEIVQLPKATVSSRLGILRARAGRLLSGEDPKYRAVHSALLGLLRGSPYFTADEHSSAHSASLHLLDILLSGEASKLDSSDRLYARANAIIERHLHQACLDPSSIARELHISRRQLEVAFAKNGETVSRSIWERRTAAAAVLLATRANSRPNLLEVATRCGFMSAAHFARRFRAQFGVSPSEYRARHGDMQTAVSARRS